MKKLVGVREKGLGPGDTGSPVLHGVGDDEGDLFRPLSSLGGGTAIVGTTQAGKGVMLTNLVRQAILRGDPVVVIDPKSSKRLRNAVFAACRAAGRAKPREFHPAFPDRGIRFDPFGSFARATELATRVKAVMPADTSGAFSSFAWQAVLVVVEGSHKAEIVKKAFFGPVTPEVPASILQMHPDFTLVGDEEALSLI